MSSRKIQVTKNYAIFVQHSNENRPLDLRKHKKLMDSMKIYGFLKCFPIVVRRERGGDGKERLLVKDGQHRLIIAQTLGLAVYWVEEEVDFDVAVVNSAAKPWQLRDYAQKFAANGNLQYQEGMDFSDQYALPIGTAFALLAGTTTFSNCQNAFIQGSFKVKDRAWADAVAGLYGPLTAMSPHVKNARLLEACMAVCRVKEFDRNRLLSNADRCREKLASYSTRDAYLDMMETIYNFGRKQLLGLKSAAVMAMRERDAISKNKKNKKSEAA